MKNKKNAEFKNNKSYLLLFLKIHLFTVMLSFIQIYSFNRYLSTYHVSGTAIDTGVIAVTKPKNPCLHKLTMGEILYKQKKLKDVKKLLLM